MARNTYHPLGEWSKEVVIIVVQEGNTVKVEYEGKFDDGTVFDTSKKHGKPLVFKCGDGQVIPGFDKAVLGMEKDEVKQIKLPPAEAYGNPDPKLVLEVPRKEIPSKDIPEPGMKMVISMPNGMRLSANVVGVSDETITCDLNHPMAGRTLNFTIKIVDYHE